MNTDCGFLTGNKWFRYRTGGIIIHNDKMLFVKCADDNYYYIIGGAVEHGETSAKCIEREILEEMGLKVKADRLAVVCENFFKGHNGKVDGLDCHTVEFYYRIDISDEDFVNCNKITDNGEQLVWVPLDQISESVIKPNCIKERIKEICSSKQIVHIVEESDR